MMVRNAIRETAMGRFVLFLLLLSALWSGAIFAAALPPGFVYVDDAVPEVKQEIRYATPHNFVGRPIDGYLKPRAILTRQAAEALKAVQAELKPFGLGLKVFDAYRPQRAVVQFVRWAEDLGDTTMQWEFYPTVEKKNLFKDGYIAARSSHSRGSTVDLTLAPLAGATPGEELDMGSPFDFFGPQSWPDSPAIGPSQRAHRLLLRTLMLKHGFNPYPQEWWHFTLKNEPFPDTYFDFPVE